MREGLAVVLDELDCKEFLLDDGGVDGLAGDGLAMLLKKADGEEILQGVEERGDPGKGRDTVLLGRVKDGPPSECFTGTLVTELNFLACPFTSEHVCLATSPAVFWGPLRGPSVICAFLIGEIPRNETGEFNLLGLSVRSMLIDMDLVEILLFTEPGHRF